MNKKILIPLFLSLILVSCVKERDLSQNTVVAHILSQPDGLHPYNNNSVMRSYIFSYTQKTLISLDLQSLDYIPDLIKELPSSSEDNQTFYFELKDNVRWDDGTSLTAEDVIFSASGVTDGSMVKGVNFMDGKVSVETIVMRSTNGTIRYINTEYNSSI